jgi:adenylate cyclase
MCPDFRGLTYFLDWFYLWSPDPAQSLERAFELAQRAIALDDSLSGSHRILSQFYLWKKQHDQAVIEGERTITLDPNFADGYMNLGAILVFAGRPEEGIGLIEKAMRLNPRYPPSYLSNLGFAYREAGRCEEAFAPLKRAVALTPDFPPTHYTLAACYAESNRLEEARAEVAEILRTCPNCSLEITRQMFAAKDPAALERWLAALRKAGLK